MVDAASVPAMVHTPAATAVTVRPLMVQMVGVCETRTTGAAPAPSLTGKPVRVSVSVVVTVTGVFWDRSTDEADTAKARVAVALVMVPTTGGWGLVRT